MIIEIKGTIIGNEEKELYDSIGLPTITPGRVKALLDKANGEDVTIEINSGGGDVFAANEIYYSLKTYNGNVTIDIIGLAGSAASIIAMARKSRIVPTGMIMIHNASASANGDYKVMDKTSEVLKKVNEAIANVYRFKTGMNEQQLLDLMDKETWLSAEQSKANGFVDEII